MSALHLIGALAALGLWLSATTGRAPKGGRPLTVRTRSRSADPLDVARLAERIATVIAGGCAPRMAWDAVCDTLAPGPLRDLARRVADGADPRRAAQGALASSTAIRSLAVALTVCERTGAPTVVVLSGLATALRDLHDAALARTAAFAGPRSTARILLVLPLAGLGLGFLLGADPVSFLLGSASGRAVGILGCALTLWGWAWMHRLLRSADPISREAVDPSVVLELTAGALRGGLPLSGAVRAVADALEPASPGGPRGPGAAHASGAARAAGTAQAPAAGTRALLDGFGRALGAGVPAPVAGSSLPPELRVLSECAVLSARSGAELVGMLQAAAQDSRRGRARDAEARAARLAVRLVLPTGLALLPAFIALGIVPTVASLIGGSFTTDLLGGP